MISVNLLPASYQQARSRRIRLRRWAFVLLCVTVVAAFPVTANLAASARAASLQDEVAPRRVRLRDRRDEITTLTERTDLLSAEIAQADALRAKRKWAALIGEVMAPVPDSLWLTQVRTIQVRAEHRVESTEQEAAVTLGGPGGFELQGYALDHQSLYGFIAALKSTGLFDSIQLTQAGKEPVLDAQAVRFVLVCEW